MKFLTKVEVPLRRTVSLTILVIWAAALTFFGSACSRSSGDDDSDGPLTFDLNNPTIQERLGDDNGYSFAVFYGADIHGSLETCG